MRENWLAAYDFATKRASLFLGEYARANDPFADVGRRTVSVQVTSVVRASDSSFRIAWTESAYERGSLAERSRWTAMVTVKIRPPRSAAMLRKNPLGLYVDAIDWSRELETPDDPSSAPPARWAPPPEPPDAPLDADPAAALSPVWKDRLMIRAHILSASLVALAPIWPVAAAHPADPAPSIARVAAANRTALREPSGGGYLGALQVYPCEEGMLYRVYSAPERVTDIALQPGETVISVAAGDTVRWTVGDTASGSGEGDRTHLLVKPFSAGLETNLVIMTDRRVYRLQLTSTAASAMAAIAWTYPQDELIALRRRQEEAEAARPVAAGVALEALNFDYRITGDAPAWRPLRAFDDGRQTYIEFAPGIARGEAPPLF